MKNYKEYFIVNEEPEIVYQALTTEKTIQLWTGTNATFTAEVGKEFSFYDDTLFGQNLELVPGKSIVQQWYLQEIDNPEDASIVEIKLFPHKKGTSILLQQSNIPETDFEHIVAGWKEQFFKDLIFFYKEEDK